MCNTNHNVAVKVMTASFLTVQKSYVPWWHSLNNKENKAPCFLTELPRAPSLSSKQLWWEKTGNLHYNNDILDLLNNSCVIVFWDAAWTCVLERKRAVPQKLSNCARLDQRWELGVTDDSAAAGVNWVTTRMQLHSTTLWGRQSTTQTGWFYLF